MTLGQWIGFLVLIICLYVLWQIKDVLLLVFTAVVLATAINSLVQRLQKVGLKRSWAVLLAITLVVAFFVGIMWLIVPSFVSQLQDLSEIWPRAIRRINIWLLRLQGALPDQFRDYLPDVNSVIQQLQPLGNALLGRSVAFFSSSLGFVLNLLLVLILTLMLLVNPQPYRQAFVRLFPSFYRRRTEQILDRCEIALKGWLVGILFNMTVIAVLSGLGLWILGIPLAFSQAALAGLLTFIPNVGPALSVVPPMAIALLESPLKSVLVLVLYIGIQQTETNLLTPYVMAQQVSLLPAITLLSQLFFATFFGFFGLFLALPLTVVGQVWLQEVVIKDILDGWHTPRLQSEPKVDLAIATPNAFSTSHTTVDHSAPTIAAPGTEPPTDTPQPPEPPAKDDSQP